MCEVVTGLYRIFDYISSSIWTDLESPKINDKDVPAVKHFKKQVSQDLTEHFEIDEECIASSTPFPCTAVDPQYSSLKFATNEQRITAHETILQRLNEFHLQWNLLIRTLENVDTCIIHTPSCGPK